MKFGQLIEYIVKKIFLKNHAENEAGRLVPDLFLFFEEALLEVKALVSIYFDSSPLGYTIKSNYIKLQTVVQRYAQF